MSLVQEIGGVRVPPTKLGKLLAEGVSCATCMLFAPTEAPSATDAMHDTEKFRQLTQLAERHRVQLSRQQIAIGDPPADVPGKRQWVEILVGFGLCLLHSPASGCRDFSHPLTHWSWRCGSHAVPDIPKNAP